MSFQSYLNLPTDIINGCLKYILSNTSQKSSSAAIQALPKQNLTMIIDHFNSSPWLKVAAVAGAASVVLGAYGAHGLKNIEKRPIYETANKYHFYHSLALLVTPLLRRPNLVGSLFLGGITIFCGTCYYHAITNNERVIRYTPIGGFMFILGWLAMLI